MKRTILVLLVLPLFACQPMRSAAQEEELMQLILDIQKLAQLRQILSDLKTGYDILFKGYSTIKSIAEGNFNLHKTFLDGLLAVSPAVQRYRRIADIADYQLQLVKEYKKALTHFRESGQFSTDDLGYIAGVYDNIIRGSLRNLDELAMVVTAGKLRMSDDERIQAIDRVFGEMEERLGFLRWFNQSAAVLGVQRMREQRDVEVMRELYREK